MGHVCETHAQMSYMSHAFEIMEKHVCMQTLATLWYFVCPFMYVTTKEMYDHQFMQVIANIPIIALATIQPAVLTLSVFLHFC